MNSNPSLRKTSSDFSAICLWLNEDLKKVAKRSDHKFSYSFDNQARDRRKAINFLFYLASAVLQLGSVHLTVNINFFAVRYSQTSVQNDILRSAIPLK